MIQMNWKMKAQNLVFVILVVIIPSQSGQLGVNISLPERGGRLMNMAGLRLMHAMSWTTDPLLNGVMISTTRKRIALM